MYVFFFIYLKIFHIIANTFKIMLFINAKNKIPNHHFTVITYVNEINCFLATNYPELKKKIHLAVIKQMKYLLLLLLSFRTKINF